MPRRILVRPESTHVAIVRLADPALDRNAVWHVATRGQWSSGDVRDAVEATLMGRDIRLVQRCDVDHIVAALEDYG